MTPWSINALQRRSDPLPVDDAVAASCRRLAARVGQIGREPRARVMELLIAATAHAHNATVVTRNPDLVGVGDLVPVVRV
jgi:toxin FitB